MTDMKRITVSLPDELVAALDALLATDKFKGFTKSEIIRALVWRGLEQAGRS